MQAKIYNYRGWIKETDPAELEHGFNDILIKSGFNIINILTHHFKPYGFTALFLLGESHFAIHTFPEENKTYIELSSCNKSMYHEFKRLFDAR